MISEKGFLTWKGNILLFWVKLAGLSKCIHISALTAWSTNKKRQQSLMKYKTKIKCITTYVSSLLVVRTVVPTGKKRSQKKRWTDKTLLNNCKQQKIVYFVKLSFSTCKRASCTRMLTRTWKFFLRLRSALKSAWLDHSSCQRSYHSSHSNFMSKILGFKKIKKELRRKGIILSQISFIS